MCTRTLEKEMPRSLGVDDMRAMRHASWTARAMRTPVLILVAGDVAQSIHPEWSANRKREGPAVKFLYNGSEFDRNRDAGYKTESEFEPGYVKITFYGSVTVFTRCPADCVWRPSDTAPIESSNIVLPRILPEAHLDWISQLFASAVHKSARDSTWLVEREDSVDVYSEHTRAPRSMLKAQARREADPGQADK